MSFVKSIGVSLGLAFALSVSALVSIHCGGAEARPPAEYPNPKIEAHRLAKKFEPVVREVVQHLVP